MKKSVQLLVFLLLGVGFMTSLDIPTRIIAASQGANSDQWQRATYNEAGTKITTISGFKGLTASPIMRENSMCQIYVMHV